MRNDAPGEPAEVGQSGEARRHRLRLPLRRRPNAGKLSGDLRLHTISTETPFHSGTILI